MLTRKPSITRYQFSLITHLLHLPMHLYLTKKLIVHTQAENTDVKLRDIRQQVLTEIAARCNGCDPSALSITKEVFRCFSGSESAVTYRALMHETYQVLSLELTNIIERWISSGTAIVVQSLVLEVEQSCPVAVLNANVVECTRSVTSDSPLPTSESDSNTVAVIVGGASAALLGAVLLVGLIVIITVITIVKHKQAMAKLNLETRFVGWINDKSIKMKGSISITRDLRCSMQGSYTLHNPQLQVCVQHTPFDIII